MNYEKNILNELRLFVVSDGEAALTDESMVKAVTLNENLRSLGFQLKPKDLVRVAKNASLDTFWKDFQALVVTDIKAKPMYPDFPQQVMDIDEAEFRFHQVCHYFSTYGLEELFGIEVRKGWRPDVRDTEKTESETALIPAKTIGLITESEKYIVPVKQILSKRERMTIPETEIVVAAVPHLSAEELAGLDVPFKENLIELFRQVMDSDLETDVKIATLHALCQHTGDVWKCLEFYISKYHRYKLSTSQKKTIVRLFETYPVEDFRANLIISNKNARRIITLLEFLSFNNFVRSEGHREAVFDLRNNNLFSWNSVVQYMIAHDDAKTISFIGKRPGILLRMINELVSKGFDPDEIAESLVANASKLSTQTLVSTLTFFTAVHEDRDERTMAIVRKILSVVLFAKLRSIETPLKGRKVFLDPGMICLERSFFAKSEEGGYIRSGMTIRIPETIQNLRFFCYWNDERRIDIDLHAYGKYLDGSPLHIGWNSHYKTGDELGDAEVIFSGDLTHSDSAEYIDLSMDAKDIDSVSFDITSYTRQRFASIDTVYTGVMAVNSRGAKIRLYDPKQCLFTHELRGNTTDIKYGYIDVQNRLFTINAMSIDENLARGSGNGKQLSSGFTIRTYLDYLFRAQDVTLVDTPDAADIILSTAKAEAENGISLTDKNYFMDL